MTAHGKREEHRRFYGRNGGCQRRRHEHLLADGRRGTDCGHAGYGRPDFASKLASASDNRFTFMWHPGMPPTNNGSECDIRDGVVPIREAFHKFRTL